MTPAALSRTLRRLTVALVLLGLFATTVGPATSDPRPTYRHPTLDWRDEPYPGFSSPYLGHSGFRNEPLAIDDPIEIEREAEMGLQWTFVSVIWPLFEPTGPTDAGDDPVGAWAKLDRWLGETHRLGLNPLLQVAMSGNGIAPPPWAGYRTPVGYAEAHEWSDPEGNRHSTDEGYRPGPPRMPLDVDAVVDFYRKMVRRYRPGGELATEQGWTDGYGVRAWEIDNEPDAYGLWFGQLDDYAELVTKVAAAIREEDPQAYVVGPASAGNGHETMLRVILDKRMQDASLQYRDNGVPYCAGPVFDVVSWHLYEQLDGQRVEDVFAKHKAWYDHYADQAGCAYSRDREYWHTEGGFDFGGQEDDQDLVSRWLPQYLMRGFAAGSTRMIVMDMHTDQRVEPRKAMKVITELLPHPHPVVRITGDGDAAQVYRSGSPDRPRTYVAWATDATTQWKIPVRTRTARIVTKYGEETVVAAKGGVVTVTLEQAEAYNEPLFVVEQR